MAQKAGRVGINPSEVDPITGKLLSGTSITVVDNLNSDSSTDALSAKQGKVLKQDLDSKEDAAKIGGLEFRNNEGTAQYRLNSSGEWINFSSGVVLPSIDDENSNYTLLLIFSMRTTPTGDISAKVYGSYSQSTGLSDLIGTCDMYNISDNTFMCLLNLTSGSSLKTYYLNICDGDTVIQVASYNKGGNGSIELGNLATNVNLSSNETGTEYIGIY